MGLQKVEDPITGEQLNIVKGEVDGVFKNKLTSVNTFGGGFTPTHSINLKMSDGTYVGLGLTDKPNEGVRCKDKSGKYHDLQKGMQVSMSVDVSKNGEHTNLKTFPKNVTILDATVKKQSTQSGAKSNTPFKKKGGYQKDNSGIECGHALNGAMNLLGGKMTSKEEYLELAKKVHDATVAVKATHAANNPDLDDYAVGASAGNAVLNACTLLTKTKVDQLEEKALAFLTNFSEPLLQYIKDSKKPEEPAISEKQESHEENIDDMEFDDDIPF